MSVSTVPVVRAALVTRFSALLTAAGDIKTQVTYGHPGQKIPTRFVAVHSTESGIAREQRTVPLRQSSSRTETYGLVVILWNQEGRYDDAAQRRLTEACWATFDVLDTGLRANPSLNGVVTSALFTKAVDDDFVLTEGRAAQIVAIATITVNRA